MELEVLQIGYYNEGVFIGRANGENFECRVINLDKWDKLYDCLGYRKIKVNVHHSNGNVLFVSIE